MKKMMVIAAGAIALGSVAQGQDVPPPPPAPVPLAVAATAPALEEIGPGALCKTYLMGWQDRGGNWDAKWEFVNERLASAVPVDQGYDDKGSKFDGKNIAKHKYDVVAWEGVFVAKQKGVYVFTIDSDYPYVFRINGVGVKGRGQANFEVALEKGPNTIWLWHLISDQAKYWGGFNANVTIDYRLSSSKKPAKPVTPSMLCHIEEEEEEW